MRSGWKTQRLGDICEIIKGRKPNLKSTCGKNDLPYLVAKVLRGGTDIEYADTNDRNSITVNEDETIIICDGSNSGEVFYGYKGILSSTMGKISKKVDINDTYLRMFLNSTFDIFNGAKTGAAIPHLDKEALYNLHFSYPSLSEQKQIVAILDEAFEGIATATANAEKNLANARELFETYLNSVFAKKGDGWVEKRLGDNSIIKIIDGDRGANYPKKTDFLEDGFCLFLNTKNVRPDGFNFDTTMFITEEKDKSLRNGKLCRRDVLLTTRGTIGNIALYDDSVDFDNVRINSGMLIFRPNENFILSEYLFEILRSGPLKAQMAKFVSGAAQPQLPIKTLVSFTFPLPKKLETQKEIVLKLHTLSEETNRLEDLYQQKLSALAELKQSLLQKAFAGELTAETANAAKKEAVA